jgi:metal-responsive CopG/Arc/MetJ family transcriptional regulator
MKRVQFTIDERLLAAVDADPEVKRDCRSAVLRRALFEYLRQKRRCAIADAYRRAYAKPAQQLPGWSAEGAWPAE